MKVKMFLLFFFIFLSSLAFGQAAENYQSYRIKSYEARPLMYVWDYQGEFITCTIVKSDDFVTIIVYRPDKKDAHIYTLSNFDVKENHYTTVSDNGKVNKGDKGLLIITNTGFKFMIADYGNSKWIDDFLEKDDDYSLYLEGVINQ